MYTSKKRFKKILSRGGFTLIELSIVLVIIGLITGGVLAGRHLIRAAEATSQVQQIYSYQQAMAAFKVKYNYLPGDIPDPQASAFGFTARGTNAGEGDGNGFIEGSGGYGFKQDAGENVLAWVDLTQAGMIPGTFPSTHYNGQSKAVPPSFMAQAPSIFYLYFPAAKLGGGNYLFIHGGGTCSNPNCNSSPTPVWAPDGMNYLTIEAPTFIGLTGGGQVNGSYPTTQNNGLPDATARGIAVDQAFAIDTKMDDGLPMQGKVTAQVLGHNGLEWTDGHDTSAYPNSPTTCYDNNGVTGTQIYSMVNDTAPNCALSITFPL